MKIPILRLGKILLTSFQEGLTDRDAIELQYDLLDMISKTDIEGVVIDITALNLVDSYLANLLNETAHMVKILGAEVVVSGIQPLVALTLVEMRRDIMEVQTALNLERGVNLLNRIIERNNNPRGRKINRQKKRGNGTSARP